MGKRFPEVRGLHMARIALTGYLRRAADGTIISHCNELDVETCGDSIEEIQQRTVEMIIAYFAACQKLGTLRDVLEGLRETDAAAAQRAVPQGQWRAVPTDLNRFQFDTEFADCRG